MAIRDRHAAHTLFTGTPLATTLLTENFDAARRERCPPAGRSLHGGGANTVPWITSNTFCRWSNAAFHQNANDNGRGPGQSTIRFERLFSPHFVVPADADYVTLEFDVCTTPKHDPNFNVLAYDGLPLRVPGLDAGPASAFGARGSVRGRVHDRTASSTIRSTCREAVRRISRTCRCGPEIRRARKHVRLRLPGMAGTTAQLRFEFTQDGIATCSDVRPGHTCGVSVDNIVVRSVTSTAP